MKTTIRWILSFVALSTLAPQSRSQPKDIPPEPKPAAVGPARDGGTQLFRGLLHHFKIQPMKPEKLKFDKNTIVIVLGDPGADQNQVAAIANQTLSAGGAVLIATDKKLNLNPYFPKKGDLKISGDWVVDSRGQNSYLGINTFPFTVPTALIPDDPSPEEQLFSGFSRIATNAPSRLQITARPPMLGRTVAVFPDTVSLGGNVRAPLKRSDSFAAAGVGKTPDTYRCLVMADQSVLANDMLYSSADAEPTDNFAFAVRLVPWLQGPEQRTTCLFIEDGKMVSKFDEFDFASVQSNPMPKMPAPKLPNPMDRKFQAMASKVASEVVTKAEDNDSFKNALARDTRSYVAFVSIVVVLAAILASVLLRGRIWKSGHVRNFQPVPVDPLRLGKDVPLGSFGHRRLEILRGHDFRALFSNFVNLMFLERGYPADAEQDHCPKIESDLKNRRHLLESVRRLWAEANTRSGKPLGYTQWKELEPMLAAVRSAADADRWRFAPRPDSEGAA